MSVTDRLASEPDDADLSVLPTFGLEWAADDDEDPDEVTIFDPREGLRIDTNWLTMDIDHVVDLEDVA